MMNVYPAKFDSADDLQTFLSFQISKRKFEQQNPITHHSAAAPIHGFPQLSQATHPFLAPLAQGIVSPYQFTDEAVTNFNVSSLVSYHPSQRKFPQSIFQGFVNRTSGDMPTLQNFSMQPNQLDAAASTPSGNATIVPNAAISQESIKRKRPPVSDDSYIEPANPRSYETPFIGVDDYEPSVAKKRLQVSPLPKLALSEDITINNSVTSSQNSQNAGVETILEYKERIREQSAAKKQSRNNKAIEKRNADLNEQIMKLKGELKKLYTQICQSCKDRVQSFLNDCQTNSDGSKMEYVHEPCNTPGCNGRQVDLITVEGLNADTS